MRNNKITIHAAAYFRNQSNEDFADLSRAYNIKISKIIPDFFLKAKIVLPWCLSIFGAGLDWERSVPSDIERR